MSSNDLGEEQTCKGGESEHTESRTSALKGTLESIDSYWFGYGSPTAIGLFRIAIGFMTIVNLLMLALNWEDWYSERGFVPAWLGSHFVGAREDLGFGSHVTVPIINLLNGTTDDRINLAFFIATIIVAILTTLGMWTRASSILLALGIITLQHRNAAILHGGDSVIRLGCIYCAIAPSGAACSLDRLIGLWKGYVSPGAEVAQVLESNSRNVRSIRISMWPQRLIAYNVALIYLTTTWLKWGGGAWKDGTATFYTAQLAEFKRFPSPQFLTEGSFIAITTYGTLFVEFALGTLVFFRPLRGYVLLAGILMHAYVEYSMNIPLFSYLMVSTYICFYDGEEIEAWAIRVGSRLKRWQVTVFIPTGMTLSANAANFLDAIDPFRLVAFTPSNSPDWTATHFDGTPIKVTKALSTRYPPAWISALYPPIWNRILTISLEPNSRDPLVS